MAGIPDMLTDIRTTGQGVPMGGQPPMGRPPMGGPPPGQPPMGRPPMGSGIASMGGGQPPMGQPPMGQPSTGGGQPPMGMEEPPMGMEEPVSIEQDSAALAEAVVGRAQGDIGAAVAILDTAKAMLMQGGQEDPMMMMGGGPLYREDGGPMYANMGRPLYREDGGKLNPGLQALQRTNPEVVDQIMNRNMGGPLYAQEGRAISDLDTDTLKQMIADSLLNSESVQSISPMGYNMSGRGMSDRDMEGPVNVPRMPRETLSDKAQFLKDAYNKANSGRTPSSDSQQAANAAIAYQMSLR